MVEKIIYTGKSLSRIDGKVVLSNEGLPGETIEAEPVKEKKNYIEAKILKVLTRSPNRTEPRCGHYKICSPYQYITYPQQIKIKEEQVREIFSKHIKEGRVNIILRPAANAWNYRNKMHLHIVWENNEPSLAYHSLDSQNEFTKIKECFLVSERINRLLDSLINITARHKMRFIKEVSVRENSDRNQILLTLYGDSLKDAKRLFGNFDELKKAFPLRGIVYADMITNDKYLAWGNDFIEENIDGVLFNIGSESFFQVNIPLLKRLVEDIKGSVSLRGDETILDLYCGVGTFGLLLASKAARVIGIESYEENVFFARRNAQLNNINNFIIHKGECEKYIDEVTKTDIGFMIIDPPRKGITKKICDAILKKPIASIAYISCDPATLARDLNVLFLKYKLKLLYIYDFFPQTTHVEIMAFLERRTT